MTVMLDRFFGVHPEIVRSGVLKDMSEGEIRLYLALMERSEYRCNRELTLTDEELRELVGIAPRTSCNARKSLQERHLIQCKRMTGNKYRYTICDPKTCEPYPGHPKKRTDGKGLRPVIGTATRVVLSLYPRAFRKRIPRQKNMAFPAFSVRVASLAELSIENREVRSASSAGQSASSATQPSTS